MDFILDALDTIKKYAKSPSVVDIYTAPRVWLEQKLINLGDSEDISQITDHIFISGISATTNLELLKRHGITHIISVISTPLPHQFPNDFTYYHFKAYDHEEFPISRILEFGALLISDILSSGGKVLVHCMAGVSRSVSVVLGYLIYSKFDNLRVDQLLAMVKQERPAARPNDGFMRELYRYELYVHGIPWYQLTPYNKPVFPKPVDDADN